MTHRLCTAPMMDWTDRHCRVFLRHCAPHARLYTEMVGTGALLHGDAARHLEFDAREHPVAIQLGGSEPDDLAACARMAERRGYDEVNLNVGCPSERVQRGAFGACLMAEPRLVADCVRAMRAAVTIPVSVKHRVGIDRVESYEFVRDFVGTVAEAGCGIFIVHARNAWLQGLSPKENREIPPLRYEFVHRLKREFPALTVVLNGGLVDRRGIETQVAQVDGVMLGRAAYHDPWLLAAVDAQLFGEAPLARRREEVVRSMFAYAVTETARGTPLRQITRHLLGLYHAMPRARLWRRMLSDAAQLARDDPRLLLEALDAVEGRAARAA
ncbi:MAG: tRNA dihydrouridine(20/20a) synthase DusA [Betaproteobacteria bacterium]|nr:tRNA dihydrouridine(20/20a) synthase DusA [Betaproteobacteria bacterium]